MKFVRTKQLMFTNNKGGVGKTTTAFNIAKIFAKNGYKTVIIDLDPQCNISRLALGDEFMNQNLFSNDNIYGVLENIITGKGDINNNINFTSLSENLSILQGNIKLSIFERMLSTGFNESSAGQMRGFVITSAIDRFLKQKGLNEEIDLFIIDTNPGLTSLNKTIFLGTDYFILPNNPDAFNIQGIENIGNFFEEERKNWTLTSAVLARSNDIPSSYVLRGEPLFIGYIINSYNVYSKKPITSQQKWINKLPIHIKKYLSMKQSKNGLVDLSWEKPIGEIQDYGQLSTLSQEKSKAIFEITEKEAGMIGTIDNLKKSKKEFQIIYIELLNRLNQW